MVSEPARLMFDVPVTAAPEAAPEAPAGLASWIWTLQPAAASSTTPMPADDGGQGTATEHHGILLTGLA